MVFYPSGSQPQPPPDSPHETPAGPHQPYVAQQGHTPQPYLHQGARHSGSAAPHSPEEVSPFAESPYSGASKEGRLPRLRRWRVGGALGAVGALLGFCALFFGGSYVLSPDVDADILPTLGTATVDGHQVVLAPYESNGVKGMFQMLTGSMFEIRLAAVESATGDLLWDVQLTEELGGNARALASGEKYTYVTTDAGLQIRDLDDGSLVVDPDEIDGLGNAYVAAYGAYGYDPAGRSIVAMDATGGMHTIPVDSTEASPADAETSRRWTGQLSADKHLSSGTELSSTSDEVAIEENPDGEYTGLEMGPVRTGAPMSGIFHVRKPKKYADDETTWERIGTAEFFEPAFVLEVNENDPEDKRPAGWSQDFYLIQHYRHVNSDGYRISVVDRATGEVRDSLDVGSSVGRALALPDGTTVFLAALNEVTSEHNRLVTIAGDGTMTAHEIGEKNFFGAPA